MYWFIILNGTRLPEPYETFSECSDAMDRLRAKLCAPIISCVYE